MTSSKNQVLAETIKRAWKAGETGFYIQTSGSTGNPKGFMLEREKVIWSCEKTRKFLHISSGDSIYCCLPVNRIGGWMQVARAMVWNCKIQVAEPSADPMANYAGDATIISLTPMQLFSILASEKSREKLNRFRIVLLGGGPLTASIIDRIAGMRPVFYLTYGMTETYSHVAMQKLNSDAVFKLLPETEIKLNTDHCLCIRNFVTDNQWLETRDIAEFKAGGFVIKGRMDNVVNSGGVKIFAEEVERMLVTNLSLPENSFFYAGLPDEKLGEIPALIVNNRILKSLPPLDPLFANNRYALPRKVIFVSDFLFTETGKLQRKKILEQVQKNQSTDAERQ